MPQSSVPPQPSGTMPQLARSSVQVWGWHTPQLCVRPLQVPAAHWPQKTEPPHASVR